MALIPLTIRFDEETEYAYIQLLAQRAGSNVPMAEVVRKLVRDARSKEYLETNADDIINTLVEIISSTIRHEFKSLRTLLASGAIESAWATILTQKAILLLSSQDKRSELMEMFERARITAYQNITKKDELRDTLHELDLKHMDDNKK